jgi:hypothetical protein
MQTFFLPWSGQFGPMYQKVHQMRHPSMSHVSSHQRDKFLHSKYKSHHLSKVNIQTHFSFQQLRPQVILQTLPYDFRMLAFVFIARTSMLQRVCSRTLKWLCRLHRSRSRGNRLSSLGMHRDNKNRAFPKCQTLLGWFNATHLYPHIIEALAFLPAQVSQMPISLTCKRRFFFFLFFLF